jgi:hypothetical protein
MGFVKREKAERARTTTARPVGPVPHDASRLIQQPGALVEGLQD